MNNFDLQSWLVGFILGLAGKPLPNERTKFSIEWDGNITGLTKWSPWGYPWFKVSDLTPSPESLIGGTYTEVYYDPIEYTISESDIETCGDCYYVGSSSQILIVPYDNAIQVSSVDGDEYAVLEKGIYFNYSSKYVYIIRLSTP